VVIKPPVNDLSSLACDGSVELSYLVINNIKLNGKDHLRLLHSFSSGISTTISRKEYKDGFKTRLKDLYMIKFEKDNLLYATSFAGQSPILALPEEVKGQNQDRSPLSSYYSIMISGEAIEGKERRKLNLALNNIWKIYFVPEGTAIGDALFRHAVEEQSVVIWDAYLKKTNNYRFNEARAHLRNALIGCANNYLGKFRTGDYYSINRAKEHVTRAETINIDSSSQQINSTIAESIARVENARKELVERVQSRRWDEAIEVAQPARAYLGIWPDAKNLYEHAVKQSHDLHLANGELALKRNELETALGSCVRARDRSPTSERANSCICEARHLIALRDADIYRKKEQPKVAKEILEKDLLETSCLKDPRVETALIQSKCEYSKQLLVEAKDLISNNKELATIKSRPRGLRGPILLSSDQSLYIRGTPLNLNQRRILIDARNRLLLANQLCINKEIEVSLNEVGKQLSTLFQEEAERALQRDAVITAYLYLKRASQYEPDNSELTSSLSHLQQLFDNKRRVNIGVVIEDRVGNSESDHALREISAELESIINSVGLANPILLDRTDAEISLGLIQSGDALKVPTIILFGEIMNANVDTDETRRDIDTSFSYQNPEWTVADNAHDKANDDLKKCLRLKNHSPSVDCSSIANYVSSLREDRDKIERTITESYTYHENQIRVEGYLRLLLQATDTISNNKHLLGTLVSSVEDSCTERSGVHPKDTSLSDNTCYLSSESSYLGRMIDKVKAEARSKVYIQLKTFPERLYRRAISASSREQAVEEFLNFLFITSDRSGDEAIQAMNYISSYDPDLKIADK
jgi:hypothetical protein